MALDDKARLKQLIIDRGLFVSREPITLSSGLQTHHYDDLKKVLSDAEDLRLVSILMIEEIVKLGEVKSVGGFETGAIPISLYQPVNYWE
jgi:orotate phosphoribosyltransferase